jgi:hypothetical protein
MGEALGREDLAHRLQQEEERIHRSESQFIQTRDDVSEQFRIALELAAGGLPMVRLRSGSNIPNVREWQRHATTDPALLEEWNDEQPDCNWGVLVGNGVGVLDLDTKSDPDGAGGYDSLIDVEELLDLDLSNLPHVLTASGSHLYFRYSGRLDSKVPWVPNLDVKADGGHQVAAPGTVRVVEGREVTYRLVRGDLSAIPEAPEALLAAIRGWRVRSSSVSGSGTQRPSGLLPSTHEAITNGLAMGNRNDTMHRLACRWWREYGLMHDSEVYGLARKTWEATPDHESFGWAEVEVTVESARRFVKAQQESDARFIAMWKESRRGA